MWVSEVSTFSFSIQMFLLWLFFLDLEDQEQRKSHLVRPDETDCDL